MTRPPLHRIAAIYNARSGAHAGLDDDAVAARLRAGFAAAGVAIDLHPFVFEDIARIVDDALESAPDALFVAGGDGTILAVVDALDGHDVPVGLLPCGTMNMLARDLGIPLEMEAAITALVRGTTRRIDVARVNGRPFLCASMIGLFPHLGRVRERARGGAWWQGIGAALRQALEVLRRYPRVDVQVRTGTGETQRLRSRAIFVSNNPLDAGASLVPGRARLDTGYITAYIATDRSNVDLLRIAIKVLLGRWQDDAQLHAVQAREVTLGAGRARRIQVMNDGEATTMQTPLHYTVDPGALRVLVPADAP